jgi:hypothetical protein
MQVPKTSLSLVGDQPLEFNTHLHGRIPIHSPPVAFMICFRDLVYLNE